MTTPTAYERIWHGLGESTREQVIVEAVEAQDRLEPEPRRRLHQSLDLIKLDGFRNARRASADQLRSISRYSTFKPKEAGIPLGFLFAWASLRSALLSCLREEALSRGHTRGDDGAEDLARLADVAVEEWKALVEHGAQKFVDTPLDVVEVGLLTLRYELVPMATETQAAMTHGQHPQPTAPGTDAVLLPPWPQMLDEARALASEDPAWAQLGDYLDRLQRLAAEKQAGQDERDRQSQRWSEFSARVQASAESLAFVEVAHALGDAPPTSDRCPDWGEVADDIEQDLAALDSTVIEQPRSLSEMSLYQEKLRTLAQSLGAKFSKLSAGTGPVATPEPPSGPLPTVGPTPPAKATSAAAAKPATDPPVDSVHAPVIEPATVEPSAEVSTDKSRGLPATAPGPKEVNGGQLGPDSEPAKGLQHPHPAPESAADSHSDLVPAASPDASVSNLGPLGLQPIWLRRGHLVRAMLAADLLEEADGAGPALPETFVPSWMCYLAARCNDRKSQLLRLDVGQFVGQLNNLAAESVPRQRFLASWLSAALLSQGAVPAMQCCEQLRPDLWKTDWWDQHDLLRFCRDQILQPASHGQLLELDTLESVGDLERGFKKELEEARQITRMAHSYKNSFVKRVWTQMVAVDGPVLDLLADTERGVVGPVPTAQEVAEQVDGWGDVISSYRNNVISRLEKCLGHVTAARSYSDRLERRASTKARSLNVEQAKTALGTMKKLFVVLEEETCPSLGGFHAVHEHLSRWTMGAGGKQ